MFRQLELLRELPSGNGQVLYCCLMVLYSTVRFEMENIFHATQRSYSSLHTAVAGTNAVLFLEMVSLFRLRRLELLIGCWQAAAVNHYRAGLVLG